MTHSFKPNLVIATEDLLEQILETESQVEGVTISGGEPLQQLEGLLELLKALRQRSNLSIILYSGYTRDEISGITHGSKILGLLDVLIDGRYDEQNYLGDGMRGSSNQNVYLITNRYSLDDIKNVPIGELHIETDGNVTVTGIIPFKLKR